MRDPDQFDAFYKDARDRLLLQTFALTGDLPAARAAVRDAFVAAWHHWRKVSRLEDPESWVRPHAWTHATRRHNARLRHRDKHLDPGVAATLDALGRLSATQRRVLVLNHLAAVSMPGLAREVGLRREDAERELQTATSQFSLHRDVPSTSLPALFEPLREHALSTVRWPRVTILRRAGTARRRTHTTAGVVAAVAALVVTGTLVSDSTGLRPTLDRDTPARTVGAGPAASPAAAEAELPTGALLGADAVARATGLPDWEVGDTTNNTEGDGLVLPCQAERYADRRGTAALVRTFATADDGGRKSRKPGRSGRSDKSGTSATPGAAAYQDTEVSRTERAAGRTYDTTVRWYAGCGAPRAQLLTTHHVAHVGDEATLVVLRSWAAPTTTVVAGVARTGRVTTTTLTSTPGRHAPSLRRSAALLADAVDGLCEVPGGGRCAGHPRPRPTPPVPVGDAPALLAPVDLPPVGDVTKPWVGTDPRRPRSNMAATRCDEADFTARGVSRASTRSFVIPGARLPDEFGLTETVGAMPQPAARRFVSQVRDSLAGCADEELGTEVQRLADLRTARSDLSVWQVTTEISDHSSVRFWMGIARDRTSVAQVGFVPGAKVGLRTGDFTALVRRALERLGELPPPGKGR